MYLIRSNWPAVEDHKSLPLSHWFSSWLLLAHERAVPSLAEESPRSLAGVVGSASYPPAAAGPVNRAVDHIPCSLYLYCSPISHTNLFSKLSDLLMCKEERYSNTHTYYMRNGMYWPAGETLPLCVLSLLVHVWPDDCVGSKEKFIIIILYVLHY